MVKLNKVLAGAVCMLALLGAGCAGGAKVDQSSPEAVVTTFMNAIKNQDKASAKAVADPDSDIAKQFDEGWSDVIKVPLTAFTIKKVDGNTVNVDMVLSVDGETRNTTNGVQVVEKNGKWFIVDL
ncbi:MAG: hypothetical protein WC813_00010 [Patescibacteria group bacterium]|jgi:hypothetical protein